MASQVRVLEYSVGHEIAIREWERDRFGHHASRPQWDPSRWSSTEVNASAAIAAQALGIPVPVAGPERYAIARALLRETLYNSRVQTAMLVFAVNESDTKVDVTQDSGTDKHRERARKYMQRKRAKAKLEAAI